MASLFCFGIVAMFFARKFEMPILLIGTNCCEFVRNKGILDSLDNA